MPPVKARDQRTGVSRSVIVVLAFVMLLAVPVTAPPPAEAASLKDQIAAQKSRQQDLTKSIAKSQRLVESLKKDESSTRSDLSQTIRQLKGYRADLIAVEKRIETVKARLKRIEARHAQLVEAQRQTDFTLGLLEQELAAGEIDLKSRRESLGRRIADAYRTENTSLLDQVFTADSFSDVLTDTSAYLAYGEQDAQLAREIVDDQQALDNLRLLTTSTRLQTDQLRRDTLDTQAKVDELREDLAAARKRLRVLKAKAERTKKRQEAQVALIVKNKKQAQAIVAKQQASRNRLMRSIRSKVAAMQARATRTFGGGIQAGRGGGKFTWPASGRITQPYGCTGYGFNPPRGSCSGFHDGIDIAGASGSSIVAAANGVVAYAGYNQYESFNPALIVVIAHGGGISTLYAHMSSLSVRVGQTVRKGSRIGSMGSTGRAFGTHLHFEVWAGDWSPVNPYSYL